MDALRAEVAAVLGSLHADLWLRIPHAYLGGQTPRAAGKTPAARERLEEMIGALLDVAFL